MLDASDLPKGMEPSALTKAPEPPAPLTLARGNYAGAIRRALDALPVEVRVDRCLVLERSGRPPEVSLRLTIIGEKEGYGERDSGPSPPVAGRKR
jgi:hypothetical protein